MEVKNVKRYSYSFKLIATRLLLQTPDGDPHKKILFGILNFESVTSYQWLNFYIVTNAEFKNLNLLENGSS